MVKPYQIPSESMEPTLDVGQRVLVNRVSYRLGSDPALGDIVVFHPPAGADRQQVRGTEGAWSAVPGADRLSRPTRTSSSASSPSRATRCRSRTGIPIVNGESFTGDWEIRPCRGIGGCDFPKQITIPPDHYFMMGDNRGASDDSRYWGPVPRDWIIGEAFFTYWPPDRIGFL